MNVGRASVERAKAVQREAVPEIVKAVEQGEVSVSAAAQFVKQNRGVLFIKSTPKPRPP